MVSEVLTSQELWRWGLVILFGSPIFGGKTVERMLIMLSRSYSNPLSGRWNGEGVGRLPRQDECNFQPA